MNSDGWAVVIVFAVFPIAFMITAVTMQRFKTQERLRLIEKGLPLPPDPAPRMPVLRERHALSPWEAAANFRVAGNICVAVGLGLLVLLTALAATLPAFPNGVIAVSAIPFFVGLAFLIEYRTRRREFARDEQRSAPR